MKKYTKEEKQQIEKLVRFGKTNKEIPALLNRPFESIKTFIARNCSRYKIVKDSKTKAITYEIDKKTGCWICASHYCTTDYLYIQSDGTKVGFHRKALEEKLGRRIKKGMYACHICDNISCINPDHLYEGTHKSNMLDKVNRNRQAKGE